jgi:Flp pilus assembly protein TadG
LLNLKRNARQLGSADGAEIAEAALVLPLVCMLLLGIIWFGRAFNIYSTIQQAAQQGAIKAARATCATCDPDFPGDYAVQTAVEAVMKSSNLDPAQIPTNSNPPTPFSCVNTASKVKCATSGDKITICRHVMLNSSTGATQPAQCGVVVSFQYPFQFNLPFTSLNMQPIMLSAQAQSRMEN